MKLTCITSPPKLLVEATSDTGISVQTATALVTINVVRNEFGPVFALPTYIASVQDTEPIGFFLVQATATDNDNVSYIP